MLLSVAIHVYCSSDQEVVGGLNTFCLFARLPKERYAARVSMRVRYYRQPPNWMDFRHLANELSSRRVPEKGTLKMK